MAKIALVGVAAGAAGSIGTIASIASIAFSALGAIQQGKAQSAAEKANAAAAARNAEISRRNAEQARIQADQAASEERREGRLRISSIRAKAGKSGVTISGSPLLAIADQAANNELEAQKILQAGEFKEQSFLAQAGLDDAESANASSRAKSARTAGFIKAGTGILSGTASLLQ